MTRRFDIRIGHIVINGTFNIDRRMLSAAVENEITRRLSEPHAPDQLAGRRIGTVDGGAVTLGAASGNAAGSIAARIGHAIAGGRKS